MTVACQMLAQLVLNLAVAPIQLENPEDCSTEYLFLKATMQAGIAEAIKSIGLFPHLACGPTSGMWLWLEVILSEQLIASMHRCTGQRSLSYGKLSRLDLIVSYKKVGWLKPPQPPLFLQPC